MKHLITICLALLFYWTTLLPATEQSSEDKNLQDAKSFRIQVNMVSLPVVVTTGKGDYVTDLHKEDFRILDNGVPQEIVGFANVEEPVSVALALDNSDSMRAHSMVIQNEAIQFVSFLRKEDRLAILSFNDDVVLWEPFSIYGRKNPMVIRKMEPRGMSAVYEAVWLALEQVLKHEYGRKALVLFSDGIDNRSETVTEEETLELARRTESTIYCIYFSGSRKRSRIFPFPGGGGGEGLD
ncbi:MAG: VWA domain-containing protein, partial [Acidobacteriota bacterium]